MTAYFGANHTGTDDDPWDFLDAAPKIPDPLPLTDTETEDEAASVQSAPAGGISFIAAAAGDPVGIGAKVRVATKGGRGRGRGRGLPGKPPRKPLVPQFKDDLVDVCFIGEAIRMYPADKSTLNETGVPKELQVERQTKTSLSGASIYLCRHPKCQERPFHAQSEAGIYSHIRRKHLGIVVACPYCVKKLFWNTKGWRSHMEHHHREAPWYGSALRAESQEASEMLQQLSTDPLAIEKATKQQEKRYRKATRRTRHPQAVSPRSGKEEVKDEPDDSSSDSDYAPPPEEDTLDSSSDSSSSDNDDMPPLGDVTPKQARSGPSKHKKLPSKFPDFVISCPHCPNKQFWNRKSWESHMEQQHCHLQGKTTVAQEMMASFKSPARKHRRAPMKPEPAEELSLDSSPDSTTSSDSDSDSPRDMPPLEDVTPPAFPRGVPPHKRHRQEDA